MINLLYILVLVIVIVAFFYFRFDTKGILKKNAKIEAELLDPSFNALVNGSGIYNIPDLVINSENSDIRRAIECAEYPLKMLDGSPPTDDVCIKTCLNSSATALEVKDDGKNHIIDGYKIGPGNYCRIGKKPNCASHITDILLTPNSVVCMNRFPRMLGGPTGSDVVACGPGGTLIDNANGGDPFDISIPFTSDDELLPDGSYRFTCKFGNDKRNNPYMPSRHDRFIPTVNLCAQYINGAHEEVKMLYKEDGGAFCYCGDADETRVKLLLPSNEFTPCVPKPFNLAYNEPTKSFDVDNLPIACYNHTSEIEYMNKINLCSSDNFIGGIDTFSFRFGEKFNYALEHPEPYKMPKLAHIEQIF